MTVQYPPAFHLSYVAIVHASSSCVIFLLFSPLCCPSFFLFLRYAVLHFSCFSAMLSFIFLVSLRTSVLRHLVVYNTAESVLCWCVLTTCISGSSFLSTYSTSFLIPTACAASNCIRPLPSCFLRTYEGWNFNSGNYLFTTDTKKIHVSKFYCPSL